MTVRAETQSRVAAASISWSALLVATRPRQWLKNGLVFAAPVAGGVISHDAALDGSLQALVVFTLASVSGYLLNDVTDRVADRAHAVKRLRPVASGQISARVALAGSLVAAVAAVVGALAADKETLAGLVAIYLVMTAAYCLGLKRVAVLELLVLASGFVLRPLAGALATNVRPSGWFLLVCCSAALTIVTGKRLAERLTLGAAAPQHREVLGRYTTSALRWARRAGAGATVACYVGWALTRHSNHDRNLAVLSLLPVIVALWRFAVRNDAGEAGAPEDLLLRDHVLQAAVLCWGLVFVIGLGRV